MKCVFIRVFLIIMTMAVLPSAGLEARVQHLVKKGETLWGISRQYNVPLESIKRVNSIRSGKRLQIGANLVIPGVTPVEGIWYEVKRGDTLSSIALRHNVDWEHLQRINNIDSPRTLQVGARICIQLDSTLGFGKPLRVPLVVTSRYGYRSHPVTGRYQRHQGIDFRAATGTRVYASKAGRITFAGRKGGYGKVVVIEHEGNYSTYYGHLSRIRVKVGQTVAKGKVIGLSGNTGVSTGPHLHFEIRYKGRSENPVNHISIP